MRSVKALVRKLLRDRKGATAVEYGFILALITIGLITVVVELGRTTQSMWNNVNDKVTAAH
jgi:pilus assembly protein Flp/PilA